MRSERPCTDAWVHPHVTQVQRARSSLAMRTTTAVAGDLHRGERFVPGHGRVRDCRVHLVEPVCDPLRIEPPRQARFRSRSAVTFADHSGRYTRYGNAEQGCRTGTAPAVRRCPGMRRTPVGRRISQQRAGQRGVGPTCGRRSARSLRRGPLATATMRAATAMQMVYTPG